MTVKPEYLFVRYDPKRSRAGKSLKTGGLQTLTQRLNKLPSKSPRSFSLAAHCFFELNGLNHLSYKHKRKEIAVTLACAPLTGTAQPTGLPVRYCIYPSPVRLALLFKGTIPKPLLSIVQLPIAYPTSDM